MSVRWDEYVPVELPNEHRLIQPKLGRTPPLHTSLVHGSVRRARARARARAKIAIRSSIHNAHGRMDEQSPSVESEMFDGTRSIPAERIPPVRGFAVTLMPPHLVVMASRRLPTRFMRSSYSRAVPRVRSQSSQTWMILGSTTESRACSTIKKSVSRC